MSAQDAAGAAARARFTDFVVGWDGSAPARAALDWALSRSAGGELTLVRVVDEGDDAAPVAPDAERERIVLANPGMRVNAELVRGEVAEGLLGYSTPGRVVVVGTKRRRGSEGRYRWSVGSRLAGSAAGPVAIIPEPDLTPRSGVVVGVDGTESSTTALHVAAEEAQRTNQSLRVVHAWMEPPVWQDAYLPDRRFLLTLQDMHQTVLDEAVTAVAARYPNLTIQPALERARPHDSLLRAGETANLLVVGNHGLRGIRRLILGSVSHAVILGLQSPTVIVPASQPD